LSLQINNFKEVAFNDKKGRLHARSLIESFEVAMQVEAGDERGEADKINEEGLEEYLLAGAYTRVLTVPSGICFVSELWKKERLWILLTGTLHVKSELGSKTYTAPYIGPAPYGTKVIGLTEGEVKFAAVTGASEAKSLGDVKECCIAEGYQEITYPWDKLEGES
jgi:hypothetical protein